MPKAQRSGAEKRLVAALRRMQMESGLNDSEWAAKMGIKQGHWSHLKREERGFGRVLAARIVERFPELLMLVQSLFLPSNMQGNIYPEHKDGDAA